MIDPIELSLETGRRYGYGLMTLERVFQDILQNNDATGYNEIVMTIQRMIQELHFHLTAANVPGPDKVQ